MGKGILGQPLVGSLSGVVTSSAHAGLKERLKQAKHPRTMIFSGRQLLSIIIRALVEKRKGKLGDRALSPLSIK
ncbi:MAG: hypothetical protein C5B53_06400 [Candidatus Melainabacteria bacterium]|nr:MAG: hypothetical protein C5B53_06400 [Candidatus Melainabacteria bacterium]